jgi:aspartyl-tRNA(Asn)/glutamyl-tRNA(Gln) amidotransferase subunit A
MAPCPLIDWRDGMAAGDLSPVFLAERCLERMEKFEKKLNALAFRDEFLTSRIATRVEGRLARGERGPMLGIPVVIKDNINWMGSPDGNGSRISAPYRSAYDATVIRRLLEAGAIPVAKANMDEFAMGSSGEHCASGPTRNPWDLERVPGGSSSGSIVSVSAGYVPFALGTDTGGSVRLPACFCNVTALRPTYGVLSRFGVTAMASSLDQVGPVAACAADLAAGFSVLTGLDPLDATSVDLPGSERLVRLEPRFLKGLRIGLPKEYFGEGIEPQVRQVLGTAIQRFASEGAELVEVSLPNTGYAIETYYLICTSEVSSNMSRFDGVRYGLRKEAGTLQGLISETRDLGFGDEVKRRVLLGAFCLSKGYYDAYYLKALKARTLITRDFHKAFRDVDILLTPVSPTLPFKIGSKTQDPLSMYMADIFTVTSSLAALPCLSLPAGFAAPADEPQKSLPVGMQLIGPPLSDVKLLEWAHAFQLSTDHHRKSPPLDA